MKQLLIVCTLCLKLSSSNAQEMAEAWTDNSALAIPAALTWSVAGMGAYIKQHFKTDNERCRAIYRWVTYYIRYDRDSMLAINWAASQQAKAQAALTRRKAVCENYSALFCEIASHCGLESFVVSGYTKQLGRIDKVGHSWCAVNLGGAWSLCDPTWDEGYRADPNYYLVSPAIFIESHMPFDPIWQLLDQPISHRQFYNGTTDSHQIKYQAEESLQDYLALDSLHQVEAAIARIRSAGIYNELIKNQLLSLEMQAGLFYEDADAAMYNSAVDDLNKAAVLFNSFVAYRNRQFSPMQADAAIRAMLEPAEKILMLALKKVEAVDRSTKNEQYNTSMLKIRLQEMQEKLQEQKLFLSRYFLAKPEERSRLFFN